MSQNNNDKRIQAAEATNIPLAEMDPKVLNDTFCIVTKSWGQTFVHRYNKSPSLNLFYPYSAIRRCAMAFTTHVIYNIILFIIVIGNLVDLAIPNSMPLFFERVSLLFYVSEAIHQSLSRGFVVGKYTYLRNPWMCFDFLLTLVSLAYSEGFRKKFFALQSLRGVRILNLVTILPGVRTMAEAVILSIYKMFGMILLFLVSLLFVTITAMHLFQGVLSQKCVKFYYHGVSASSYADFIEMEENWLKDKEYWYTCGNWTGARHCPDHYMCLPNIKNNYDYIHFEHFGAALLNSLGLITHDDWDLAVDEISKATGPISYFFLAPVIFFGSYCLLNLMVVVVISIYEAMITAKLENNKVLSAYTSYSSFQFDITQIPLYHLPTNEKTLNHIIEQREDQADHEETVKEYWKKITRMVQLKKKAVLRNVDPVNVHEAEAVSDEKKEGLCSKCRLKVKNFTESKGFQYCITVTIIVNSILLASHNANMSDATINLLELGNLICLIIFTLEMIIMIIAYGVDYFFNLWNLADFVIVVSGIAAVLSKAMADIIAFRVLRLLKLMRFQHQWTAMRKITSVILKSMKNIIRLVILMCLLILMFSIIGHRVLGPLYDYENDFNRLRWSFATFEGSTFTVFKIFAGEWIEDLWDCMLKSKNSPFCPVVFVGFYLIGNFVILNLFAALLLTSFDDIPLQLADQEDGFLKKMFRRLKKFFVSSCCKKMRNANNTENTESVDRLSSENNQSHETLINNNPEEILTRVREIIKSHKFDKIVLAVILLNCVCLALYDSTVKEKSERHKHLYRIDIFCVSFFASEMLLRLFGNGMKQYFTEGWTLFDFFMNVVSVVGIPFHSNTVLRELRSLRAISILSKFQEMKVIVRAFVLSVPAILNVLIVAFFLWLPFGIIGTHFFAGKFYRCADKFNKRVAVAGVYNKTDCYEKGYHWRNAFFNFDHIGNSYQTLMQLALYSGWGDSVLMMVDSKGNDLEPEENYDKSKYIYVVAFILVGGFLCFNLFVGAAVDAFRQKQRHVEGTEIVDAQLTLSQKKYYSAMVKFGKRKPIFFIQPPTNKFLNMFYVISFSIWFKIIIFIIICANAVFIAIDSHRSSPTKRRILVISTYIFSGAYAIELIIKLLGMRRFYFKSFWDIFDLIIFIICMIGETLHQFGETRTNPLSFIYAFRILRIFGLLHLTDMFSDLRLLSYAIGSSLIALLNLFVLLTIIIFIYSIFGMNTFGHLKHTVWIDSNVNFETFANSAMLLLRLATSEGWEKVIQSMSIQPPDCESHKKPSDCGDSFFASLFLLSFLFCTHILLTNTFIAIILDNYKTTVSEEHDIFNDYNLVAFYKAWMKFDPGATHFIPYEDLPDFLDGLISDLRMPKPNAITISFMDLPIAVGNKVHCLEVLKGILKVKLGDVEHSKLFNDLCNQVEDRYNSIFPELQGTRFVHTTLQLMRRNRAAQIIQANFRHRKQAKLPSNSPKDPPIET